jgi:chromosomal replication initiation ATPase DnaA
MEEQPTKQDLLFQLEKMKLQLENLRLLIENYEPIQVHGVTSDFRDNFETILLEKYHIDITELRLKNRNPTLSMLRQIYCYGLRKHHKYQLAKCGLMCGYTDHSTAIYAINKAESFIKVKDALFMEIFANFEHLFNPQT